MTERKVSTRAVSTRPPAWLIWSTAALTLACLGMAVTETSQWGHYLIDKGEAISLAGLAFITIAAVVLYRQRRLRASLPFALPWLLYPVITQGDQIIDNLSITAMQVICQILLAFIFWVPIAVLVLAAKFGLQPREGQPARQRAWTALLPGLRWIEQGRVREGRAVLTLVFLTLEIWVAFRLLGAFMVATLVVLILVVLWRMVHRHDAPAAPAAATTERNALIVLLIGITASFGLYVGYKNRTGAYQGSPSYLFDPSRQSAGYDFKALPLPAASSGRSTVAETAAAGQLLASYADDLQELANGRYILDRNYTHHFHNVLFARNWPILPNFRAVALNEIAEAHAKWSATRASFPAVRNAVAADAALAALLDETDAFLAFNFSRAALLEPLSAKFIETDDGLQHAAHLYEGEGKSVGMQLGDLLAKHAAVLGRPDLAASLARYRTVTGNIFDAYKDRVVGF